MLVVAEHFHGASSVKIEFNSITSGQYFVNAGRSGSFHLSNNIASKTYMWQIKPAVDTDSTEVISLSLSKLVLQKDESLSVYKDNDRKSPIAKYTSTIDAASVVYVPAKTGAYVEFVSKHKLNNETDDVILVASYEVLDGCEFDIQMKSNEVRNITTPNYPNLYPANGDCRWTFSITNTTKAKFLHLAFYNVDLNEKHPLNVTENGTTVLTAKGQTIPDDLILTFPVTVQWDSKALVESFGKGFIISVEALDDGGNLDKQLKGKFSTPGYPKEVSETFHAKWIITLPLKDEKKHLNLVEFSGAEKNKNVEILDGGAWNSRVLKGNDSSSPELSRTNKIIVSYTFDATKKGDKASGLEITYEPFVCVSDDLCNKSKICIHDDWICNGVNDCDDGTDEDYWHCKAKGHVPPTPTPPHPSPEKSTGVSGGWLAGAIIISLICGFLLAIAVPIVYKKVTGKNFEGYQRFSSADAS